MKKGRFSKTEQEFIRENHKDLSVHQIATRLDRDPASITSYVNSKLGNTITEERELEALRDLQNRPFWKDLERQFSKEELESLL